MFDNPPILKIAPLEFSFSSRMSMVLVRTKTPLFNALISIEDILKAIVDTNSVSMDEIRKYDAINIPTIVIRQIFIADVYRSAYPKTIERMKEPILDIIKIQNKYVFASS